MYSEALQLNLSSSARELSHLRARRRFYLADAASLSALSAERGERLPEPPEGLTSEELVGYASMLFDALPVQLRPSLTYHVGSSRVAYQRQGYADAAYTLFSELLDGATVLYTDSGRGAAEEVYSETADFCILPFSDREGSLVRSSRAITEELGLLLTATASVGAGESGALTYALYGRAPLRPSSDTVSLSLRAPFLDNSAPALLGAAAREVSATVCSLECSRQSALLRATLAVRAEELGRVLFIMQTVLTDPDIVGIAPFTEDEA